MSNVVQLPVRYRPAGLAMSDDAKKALIGFGAAVVLAGAAWGLWKLTEK